jgi:hypothetical protein
MYYQMQIKSSAMYQAILLFATLWVLLLGNLYSQTPGEFSAMQSSPNEGQVVLTGFSEPSPMPSADELAHIEILDFLNQPDQVIQNIQELMVRGALSPKSQLMMAHNLKKKGKYSQAKQWYKQYTNYNLERGQHFASSCQSAVKMKQQLEMQRILPLSINSTDSEFSPCGTPNGFVFFRMNKPSPDPGASCEYTMMTAEGEAESFDPAIPSQQRLSQSSGIIFMDVSPSGERIVYTKITDNECFNGIYTQGGMATYEADLLPSGDWENDRPLPFNAVGHRTAYATYGDSDDIIFYASDIASGFGGFDLYRAQRIEDRKWSSSQNLGPEINSPGHEVSPKFNGEILTFASDWHKGLGGFDIFYSAKDQGTFTPPINAGIPINSSMDDWSLSFGDQESGYFVTNRTNPSGDSDIYYFEDMEQKNRPMALKVSYRENKTSDAHIAFPLDWSEEEVSIYTSDPENTPIKVKYSIQIAVLSQKNNGYTQLREQLADLDELYKIYFEDVVKIRLGSYDREMNASLMLEKVKSRGFSDAFIVTEKMVVAHSDDEVESKSSPVINDAKPLSSSLEVSQKQNVSVSDGKFLVRLATYLHPDNFDRSKVANLGQISSLEKGPYTIFLLGNYKSIQDAQNTLSQVQSRGFTNAQIVKLQGQEIIRVKTD